MELLKCTFRTPLNGSIDCEILRSDLHGPKELNSEQMATLFHRYAELHEFLDDNKEDLTHAVPEGLSSCILKAEFGDYTMYEGNLYLLTHVWVDENELSGDLRLKIQDWITGQLSDGWGEGLEQREWKVDRVCGTNTYFDEDTLDFEKSEDYYNAFYYVTPWVSHEFYVELVDFYKDEVEIPFDPPVVHGAKCQLQESGEYTVRTIYRFVDPEALVPFMRNSGAWIDEGLIKWYEETGGLGCAIRLYLVHESYGVHSKFLSMIGVLDMDLNKAKIYSMDAEDGSVSKEEYTEDFYKDFYNDMLTK